MTERSGFPRFSGSFKTFSVRLNTNRETGTEERLLVYSQGSRAKVVNFLWYKFLWDELSRIEYELFLAMPETLNSPMKFAALRATLLYGKKRVRNKLKNCPFLTEKELPTRKRYQGYKHLNVEISRFTRNLPKVPKFKGWIKSLSTEGKGRPRGPSFLEPLAIIENDYEDNVFDWYNYLTVDEFLLLPSK